ncbi:nuclear transport factor 2 family protein [Pseudorhodoferax sp. Leaf267]|uniref:nuclear transport factor 2 family protein n=1 Tax=Pseudorhodoferax sp. Leaf267 TaxID=1736316 RepID=UPI0006FE53C2|nr:nuclear transport factor 2 family protein [Pseudorhodoferax sp. Leaf267]KQP22142.1 hypothetical protein ASF43_25270 [Pseudorhodoferax sp. Leaf267]
MAEPLQNVTALPSDLLAAMQARRQALLQMDLERIAPLLDESLRYTHSNGACEDKAGYLAALRRGDYRYHAIDEQPVQAWPLGDGFWTTGEVRMQAIVHGRERHMHNRFLGVWRRTPTGLCLAAYCATPLAAR